MEKDCTTCLRISGLMMLVIIKTKLVVYQKPT